MGLGDKITIVIDAVTGNATSAIKSFRTEVAAAQGVAGKLKAGWKSASASISANAGVLAATAGTALVTFGIKAVHAFESTAKAAVDLGKATGLSTEQASRWIAVADDYEVSASALASALGKMGKNLDAAAMEKYGIVTRDAAGNARDSNEIFLDVLETLNNTAPAERAKVGADLLGRGWGAIAPILGKTRAEYEKMLGQVERGQVVTEKEAKKAEKMRLAEDALKDALNEATLAVGGFVAEMAPMIQSVAEGIETLSDLTQEFGLLEKAAQAVDYTNPVSAIRELKDAATDFTPAEDMGLEDMVRLFRESGVSAEQATPQLEKWIAKNKDAGLTLDDLEKRIWGTVAATKELSPSAFDAAKMADKEATAFRKVSDALIEMQKILGQLDNEEAALNLADQFDETKRAAEEAFYAVASKAPDAEQKLRDAEQATIDLKRETIDYAAKVAGLPPSKVTQIVALIDEGKLAEADALLKKLTATRTAWVVPVVGSGGGNTGDLSGSSGSVGGNKIESVGGVRGSGEPSIVINVNVTTTGDGRSIVEAVTGAVKDGVRAAWMALP